MDLHFNHSLASVYHSGSQISRVLTEDWMARNMFCPVCGAPVLGHYEANKPVADFFCDDCKSDFELKSKESKTAVIGHKIADGAYGTLIERITSLRNPHLFVMTYSNWTVNNLLMIPSYFFCSRYYREAPSAEKKRQDVQDGVGATSKLEIYLKAERFS